MEETKTIKFSPEQEAIINADINNILVSAGAGSGKTTVLVERIIREICDGRLSVANLLVVTFTNDAADNMARKIEGAIRKRMDKAVDEGNKELASQLSEQLDILPNAYIQTIDSFCSRVLKEKGYLINPPEESDVFASGNVILDENNLSLILNRAAQLAIMDMYAEDGNEGSDFINLTRRYGDGRTDTALQNEIIGVFKALRSIPDYIERIEECIKDREDLVHSGANPSIRRFIDDVHAAFTRALPGIVAWEDFCVSSGRYPLKAAKKGLIGSVPKDDAPALLGNIRQYVEGVIRALEDDSLSDKEQYKAITDVALIKEITDGAILKGFLKVRGVDINENNAEECRMFAPASAVLDLVKNITGKMPGNYDAFAAPYKLPDNYKTIVTRSYDDHMKFLKENTVAASVFVKLIKLCDKYYAELKASVHGSDFADQEYGAYEVLKNREAADYYRDKFTEIYIDEYQDNSALQDAIINCFARPEGNVFRVGDIKQSIYKFRNADPDIFNGHLNNLKAEPKRESGELFPLTENHRSSVEILDFVNFLFEQLMTSEGSEIDYDATQHLKAAPDSPHSDLPRVVVVDRNSDFWTGYSYDYVAEDDEEDDDSDAGSDAGSDSRGDKARRLELSLCLGVAGEIRKYLDADPNHSEKDICILTRTVSKGKTIARFLNDHGITAISEERTKIFEDQDIQSIIHMIILIGNEYRDEYLMSILLRNFRFTNFTLDDLAQINVFIKANCRQYLNTNLMVRIRVFCERAQDCDLKSRLTDFLNIFDDIRMTCRTGDIDDIVDMIYSKSGVVANTIAEGNFGVAKYALLKDWLSGNFKRYGTDISTIAIRLEEMKHNINSDASFDSKDATEGAVTCMSIHKSKGLEYPFVILAFDDGSEGSDKSGGIVFDKNKGFIVSDVDIEGISSCKSVERIIYDNDKKIADNAEILRLLYVALTRGKMNLSVVTAADFGVRKDGIKFVTSAMDASSLYGDDAFNRSHWLIGNRKIGFAFMSAICRASCAAPLRKCIGYEEDEFARIIQYSGFEIDMTGETELQEIAEKISGRSETAVPQINVSRGMPDYGEYPDDKATRIPFKVSVTGINDWDISQTTHVDMRIKEKEEYLDKLAGRITAAGKGTIVHLIMQWADPDIYINGKEAFMDNVREIIRYDVFRKYSSEDVLAVADEFAEGIIAFAKTDVGTALNNADKAGKAEFEKPVVFAVPSYEGADRDDLVLVQGIIDSIYEEDDGSVIVDYKTDNYGDMSEDKIIEKARMRHSFQVNCYAASCEASGIRIKKKYLYLVRYKLLVEVT